MVVALGLASPLPPVREPFERWAPPIGRFCGRSTRTIDPDHPADGVPSVASILARWSGPREFRFVPRPPRSTHEGSVLAAPTMVTVTVAEDRSWPPLFGVLGPDVLSIPVVVTMHADVGWSASVFGTLARDAAGVESLGPSCLHEGWVPPTMVSPGLAQKLRAEDPSWKHIGVYNLVIISVRGSDSWQVFGSLEVVA